MGGLLGFQSGNQGAAGMRYEAGSVPILQAATGDQAAQLYAQSQQGIEQQQAFVNALQAQGGIANQTSVFNQQQALASQLQQAAQGGGPNPALAQLQQTTGQNVANQAALMASQRGASANPAAIARQAAMQGGNIQQQAVGQAATLGAQQQIAARQQLQQQQGMMGGLATQQVGQLAGGIQGYNQAVQSEQANILNAIAEQNRARVGMMSSQNAANSAVAQQTARGQQDFMKQIGSGAMMLAAAHGGEIPPTPPNKFAEGGPVSAVGRYLYGSAPAMGARGDVPIAGSYAVSPSDPQNMIDMPAKKGPESIGAMQGMEQSFPTRGAGTMAGGPMDAGAPAAMVAANKGGAMVPGKAKTSGDNLKNDTVPAMLSPGEIVIPRSIAQGPNAPERAAKFVAAVLAGNGPKPKKVKG